MSDLSMPSRSENNQLLGKLTWTKGNFRVSCSSSLGFLCGQNCLTSLVRVFTGQFFQFHLIWQILKLRQIFKMYIIMWMVKFYKFMLFFFPLDISSLQILCLYFLKFLLVCCSLVLPGNLCLFNIEVNHTEYYLFCGGKVCHHIFVQASINRSRRLSLTAKDVP